MSRDKSTNPQNKSVINNNISGRGSANSKNDFSMQQNKNFAMLSRSDGCLNKSLMRPLEVPKLEITSPHNQELIRKYEKRYSLGNNETKPPALPPRKNSKPIYG